METGVPIVPIGIWGTEAAWPRSSRVPYVMNLADPPRIRVRVGEPYHVEPGDVGDATEDLMARIVERLPDEARVHRTPSEAELALSPSRLRDGSRRGPSRP